MRPATLLAALLACGPSDEKSPQTSTTDTGTPTLPSTTSPSTTSTTTASTTSTTGSPSDTGAGLPLVDVDPISGAPDTYDEFETSIAVGSSVVAASWTEQPTGPGEFPIGFATSEDLGATWDPPGRVFSPSGGGAADSVFGVDATGGLHLVWLDTSNKSAIWTLPVDAAGAGSPARINDPAENASYDKPWIALTAAGQMLVTYQAVNGPAITGVAALSSDGVTWDRRVIATDGHFRNLFYPCVSDTGRIWVVFFVDNAFAFRFSDDDGLTWSASDVLLSTESDIPFAEPECAAQGDDLWAVYGLSTDSGGNDPKLYALKVVHSSDGATIDQRTDALDTAVAQYGFKPQLAIEADGSLDLTYYAGNADNDPNGSFRRARSTDRGATFGASLTVHAGVALVPSRASPMWPGDYSGLAVANGDLFMSYVDNSSGAAHVAFERSPP